MNYNLKTETFLLPYPDDKVVQEKLERDLAEGIVTIKAKNPDSYAREFYDLKEKYDDIITKNYRSAKKEFDERLNEKYGGFNKRMEAKHGLNRFPQKLKDIIHSKAYEEGHSSGESEVDNCYYGIVEFVDSVFAAIKG